MTQLEIPERFDRSAHGSLERAAESARFLVRYVCETLGLADLGDTELLDVGCGTKFSEAFLNDGIPIGRYVGVDVYGEMIEFLQESVADPRFEYFHLDVRNELYNPDAQPMTADTDLGIGSRRFDLIWLFSVFTHLNPEDFRSMMHVLRRYVRPTGKLFFTVFLRERSGTEHGAMEQIAQLVEAALAEGRVSADEVEALHRASADEPDFEDLDPEHPLRVAMYSRKHAVELVEGTGWNIEEILPPNEFAQHQFVCTPR
jgi:SAM-dependent methyltransferase